MQHQTTRNYDNSYWKIHQLSHMTNYWVYLESIGETMNMYCIAVKLRSLSTLWEVQFQIGCWLELSSIWNVLFIGAVVYIFLIYSVNFPILPHIFFSKEKHCNKFVKRKEPFFLTFSQGNQLRSAWKIHENIGNLDI